MKGFTVCPFALKKSVHVLRQAGFLLLLIFLVACSGGDGPGVVDVPPAAEPPANQDPNSLNILFIGNSLTYYNDLPGILEVFLAAGEVGTTHIEVVAHPNVALIDHWQGEALGKVREGGWDFVIMQQGASASEGRPYLLDYAARFAEEIKAIGGAPALFMVWPAQSRLYDFDGVFSSYLQAALNVSGYFFPCGQAWRIAWETEPDLTFYADNLHATPMGSYLAAAVMYEQITGLSPIGLPTTLETSSGAVVDLVGDSLALLIQESAAEANRRHAISVD